MRKLFLACALICIAAPSQVQAQAQEPAGDETAATAWTLDPAASLITFKSKQMGADFTGKFAPPDGEIFFDPDHMDESSVTIKTTIEGVSTGSPDRDKYITMPDWFAAEKFPVAVFTANKFSKVAKDENGGDSYLADGMLTIRDITLPLVFPFTYIETENGDGTVTAHVKGDFEISRLDFGVGQGDWTDTSMVPEKVRIFVDLKASRRGGPGGL